MKKILNFSAAAILILTACVPPVKLETYKNSEYAFQFDHPETYTEVTPTYGNFEKKLVQVQLPTASYPKTNFYDAALTVSVSTAASLSKCLSINNPKGGSLFKDSITSNEIKYYATEAKEGAAGNIYDSKLYRAFKGQNCFELATTVHTSTIGNFDPKTVTELDAAPIKAELEKMMLSFKFTN